MFAPVVRTGADTRGPTTRALIQSYFDVLPDSWCTTTRSSLTQHCLAPGASLSYLTALTGQPYYQTQIKDPANEII